MPEAVCIFCGSSKSHPWSKCPVCSVDPQMNDADMAKSIYLSSGRFAGVEEPEDWESNLAQLQCDLKAGKKINYDDAELERIMATKATLQSMPDVSVWRVLLRFSMPGIIMIVLAWLLVWLLRSLRH